MDSSHGGITTHLDDLDVEHVSPEKRQERQDERQTQERDIGPEWNLGKERKE